MNTLVIKTPIEDKNRVYYSYSPDNNIVITGSAGEEYLSGVEADKLCELFIVKSLKILGNENQPNILSNTLVGILNDINTRPMIFNQIEEISIVLDNFGTACMNVLQLILCNNKTLNKFHLKKITPASQYKFHDIKSLSEILKIPSLKDIKINYFLSDDALDLFPGNTYPNITILDLHEAFNSNAYQYLHTNFLKITDSIEKMPNLSKLILGHANCGQDCQEHRDSLVEFLAQYPLVPGVDKLTALLRYAPNSNILLSDFEGTAIIAYDNDGRSLSNFSVTGSQLEAMERSVGLREGILWDNNGRASSVSSSDSTVIYYNNGRASLASSTFSSSQLEAMERSVELREEILWDNNGRSSVISLDSNISGSFMAAILNEEVINPNRYSDMLGELYPENLAM
ncbi:hypothetical protein [Candidatus Tisiphia endosymbiont of Parasteatoda lunata]|uniref:hypothetical protein n=1 Tax=Candidatus Tisiphia endosymbiont of Parasteatoda lunata TaxID=3066275 RepID=UPI00313BE68F